MGYALPILLLLAGLVLLLGLIAVLVITLVAKRGRMTQNPTKYKAPEADSDGLDPWEEAGKRIDGDLNEPK